MTCTTKDNIIILFELQIIKSDNFYAEIKYRSETNQKEICFESCLMMLLTLETINEYSNSDCLCR